MSSGETSRCSCSAGWEKLITRLFGGHSPPSARFRRGCQNAVRSYGKHRRRQQQRLYPNDIRRKAESDGEVGEAASPIVIFGKRSKSEPFLDRGRGLMIAGEVLRTTAKDSFSSRS